jgi:hypothetical protein
MTPGQLRRAIARCNDRQPHAMALEEAIRLEKDARQAHHLQKHPWLVGSGDTTVPASRAARTGTGRPSYYTDTMRTDAALACRSCAALREIIPWTTNRTTAREGEMKALSIRQPWAWAVTEGHKTIENRRWATAYRGPLLIHAGKEFRLNEFESMLEFAKEDGFVPPDQSDLLRGGIVGRVVLVEVVTDSQDRWFEGPFGWVFDKPVRLPFRPFPGQQRLFNVE